MAANNPDPAPKPNLFQSTMARLKGLVQAMAPAGEPDREEILPDWDQATPPAAFSNVIASEIAANAFSSLKAPIKHVTALDATIAYSEPMEQFLLPNEEKIQEAVHQPPLMHWCSR